MRTLLLLAIALSMSVGCKKKSSGTYTAASSTDSGGGGAVTGGGASDTNYNPGGGALQNTRRAAERIKVDAELQQLGQLIEVQFNELGRMPSIDEIKANLKQTQSILGHITQGNIVLTGTKNHAGLWAYQKDCETLGGLALVAGTPNRYTKDDFAQIPR